MSKRAQCRHYDLSKRREPMMQRHIPEGVNPPQLLCEKIQTRLFVLCEVQQ
jgi:hypothetical protein